MSKIISLILFFSLLTVSFCKISEDETLISLFQIKILHESNSKNCYHGKPKNSKAHLNYEAYLEVGMTKVDSSSTQNEDFHYPDQITLQCFDMILDKMCEGDKITFVSQPEFAFGKVGIPGLVPPNSTIYFELEFVKIVDLGKKQDKRAEL